MGGIAHMKPVRPSAFALALLIALAPTIGHAHVALAFACGVSSAASAAVSSASPSADPQPREEYTLTVRRGSRTIQVHPQKTVQTSNGRAAFADRLVIGFKPSTTGQDCAAVHTGASTRGAGAAKALS